jgi:hypothetical protein
MIPTNGGDQQMTQPRQGTHATKWPLHAQWARPAGRTALKKIVPKRVLFSVTQKTWCQLTTFTTHFTTA